VGEGKARKQLELGFDEESHDYWWSVARDVWLSTHHGALRLANELFGEGADMTTRRYDDTTTMTWARVKGLGRQRFFEDERWGCPRRAGAR
jgi:hypothetical protein